MFFIVTSDIDKIFDTNNCHLFNYDSCPLCDPWNPGTLINGPTKRVKTESSCLDVIAKDRAALTKGTESIWLGHGYSSIFFGNVRDGDVKGSVPAVAIKCDGEMEFDGQMLNGASPTLAQSAKQWHRGIYSGTHLMNARCNNATRRWDERTPRPRCDLAEEYRGRWRRKNWRWSYSAARNCLPYHVHRELFSNPNEMTG